MTTRDGFLRIHLIVLGLLVFSAGIAGADVTPGDVIDTSNWEKAKGLLPDPVLDWVKQGDGTMTVGTIPYDPGEYLPPAVLKSLKANVGRYDVDENGLIIDVKTKKLPEFVEGLPFPQIDLNDPRAGAKIMYNKHYFTYACGDIFVQLQTRWIGRNTGFERELVMEYWTYVLDGYPPAKQRTNKEDLEVHSIIRVLAPFDIKGTNVLLWRYRDERQDSTFSYVPAIRRVRRMSPGNRSDSFLGSDFCVDDAWGYAGKVNAFDWKLVKKVDQLIPFYPGKPVPLVQNDMGEWETRHEDRKVVFGYEKDGYQGAPWWPTNYIYVKRPTYVLECKAKDPYYNYGTQYLWIDADCFTPTYKLIHDRAGDYWKTEWQSLIGEESADGKMRITGLVDMLAFDDRSQHASNIIFLEPKNTTHWFAVMDRNDYSLGGFQKLCK